ncbi:hypothetical protein GCM10028784_29440 [Myceligenerans cantabricum]
MNENRPAGPGSDDEVVARVAAALRSREPSAASTAEAANRIAGLVADQLSPAGPRGARRPRAKVIRVVGIGFAASGLVAGAAAGAAAASPAFSQVVYEATGLGIGAHYTQEQYDAFWGAGFTAEDQVALEELWGTDPVETKAKAGQMMLDGRKLPFEPGSHVADVAEQAAVDRFLGDGYTTDDAEDLAELWNLDTAYEAKAAGGERLNAGEVLPIEPNR